MFVEKPKVAVDLCNFYVQSTYNVQENSPNSSQKVDDLHCDFHIISSHCYLFFNVFPLIMNIEKFLQYIMDIHTYV